MKGGRTGDLQRLDMRKSVEVQVDCDFALLLPSGIYEIKKMEPRRRLRIVYICLVLAVAGIIFVGYFCPDQVIAFFRLCRIANDCCRGSGVRTNEERDHDG